MSKLFNYNKNNSPNYNKYIIYLLIIFILLNIIDISNILKLLSGVTISKLLFVNIILAFISLIYSIIDFYVLTLFLNGKMHIHKYTPLFLWKWLNNKEKISQFQPYVIRGFTDLYLKNIITHIIGLFILILIYVTI